MSNNQLSPEQIAEAQRIARHSGFRTSLRHKPDDKRQRLEASYAVQDQRREKNVNGFFQKLTGG